MTHLDEGVLRRLQDEPFAATLAERDHLESCADCAARQAAMRDDATQAGALLGAGIDAVASEAALARLRHHLAEHPVKPQGLFARLVLGPRGGENRALRPIAALALATALTVTFVVSGAADGFIKVFRPDHFVAVQVNPGTLSGIPDLSRFGTQGVASNPRFFNAASLDAASQALGFKVATIGSLPKGVTPQLNVVRFTPLDATFQFSATKAESYARSIGKSLPAMPNGMDGSSIHLHAGPGVALLYGSQGLSLDGAAQPEAPMPVHGGPPAGDGFASLGKSLPQVALVQMQKPEVSSDGASVEAIEAYLVSLPGVPADLAAQIRAIGDPATTLPIPVPIGQSSHDVDIAGARGLFVGDSTGLGAGVVWERNGFLFGVVGTMTEDEVLAVARSVH